MPTANIASSSSTVDNTEDANEEEPASSIAVGGSGNLETLREKLQVLDDCSDDNLFSYAHTIFSDYS